jgi:transcriptional regulator of acetoin/glycerol metabolism
LENAIEYAFAVSEAEEMGINDLPPDVLQGEPDEDAPSHALRECWRRATPLAEIERLYILNVLERCEGNQVKAAAVLGIDRRTLYRKVRGYAAQPAPTRPTFQP